MSEVRRVEYDSFYGMVDKPDGDFVWYEDYEEIQRKNDALRAERKEIEAAAVEKFLEIYNATDRSVVNSRLMLVAKAHCGKLRQQGGENNDGNG